MAVPGATLIVRVDQQGFWFQEPLGELLQLERYTLKKQEAVQRLVSMRYPLSTALQQRIADHVKYSETRLGWWLQCSCCLCLPSGYLTAKAFDYDRDLDPLRKEVLAAIAAAGLQPTDIELAEHVQSEEKFSSGGKPLFRLYLS